MSLKSLLLTILFSISIFGSLSAQDTSYLFNKTFELEGGSYITPLVDVLDDGYLFITQENSTEINNSIKCHKLDSLGNVEWSSQLDTADYSLTLTRNDLIKIGDGDYLIFYAQSVGEYDNDIRLVKFTPTGEVLWKKTVGDTTNEFMNQMIETEDKGFLLVGARQETGNWGARYAMKIDSIGEMEWAQTYPISSDHSIAYSVVEVDSGYVIGSYGQLNGEDDDIVWLMIDKQGEMVWEKSFENPPVDDLFGSLQAKSDGTYLLTGALKQYIWRGPFVAELDSNFDINWYKFHDTEERIHTLFGKPVIYEDGSFVSISLHTLSGNIQQPQIVAVDNEGNIEWTKDVTLTTDAGVILKTIKPTLDSGYVFAGFKSTGQQIGWVLKTDSIGNTCSYIGCDSTIVTSINTDTVGTIDSTLSIPTYLKENIKISPNPAKDHLLVRHEIPIWKDHILIRFSDMNGKTIKIQEVNEPSLFHYIDIEGWPSGLYLYTIYGEAGAVYQNGKFVVK